MVGLIDRKSGSGNFVTAVEDPSVLKAHALSIISSSLDPYEVWRTREAFEPAIGEMVINAATNADLESIKNSFSTLEDAGKRRDWDNYFEADYRFHMALVTATHNICVIQALEPLLSEMRTPLWRAIKENYFLSSSDNVASLDGAHKAVYIAVRDRDVRAFRSAMTEHFRILRTIMEYRCDSIEE